MQESAVRQRFEMFEHGIEGGKVKMPGYLLHARGVAFSFDEFLNEIEDLLLAFCQFHWFHLLYTG